MSTERFHKAAREGVLEVLKEATRKDCNARDEGGMTPTLWAAFEGHIDALRLLVARGGEPDKSDHFGNTALHLAAARGHEYCVKFLVKFGCNIWSLDIDRHSARELAAINGHEKILQFLDLAQSEQELNNRKKSRMLREKAEKDAEKRLKEYVKRQKAAEMKAEKAQRKLTKESTTWKGRTKPSPTFSDIVGTTGKRYGSAVCRKALAKKAVDDFKIVEIEVGGKKSVRSLSGLRRDSEVMYVGSYEAEGSEQIPRRTNLTDVWNPSQLSKAQSTPDLLADRCCDEEDLRNDNFLREPGSIFDRPGFGSVAFRRPISRTLEQLAIVRNNARTNGSTNDSVNESTNGSTIGAPRISMNSCTNGQNEEISIGSAGSLARRQSMWDDDALSDEDETDEEWTPLQRFLVANNLSSIHTILEAEQIDLEALMLLTEADIAALKLPLGPRRKLMNAIANRKRALDASANVMKDIVL